MLNLLDELEQDSAESEGGSRRALSGRHTLLRGFATQVELEQGREESIVGNVVRQTYFEQGFFNVTVDYDGYVRQKEGPVDLVLVSAGREHRVEAKVNRSANGNGTARIMGGVRLREWFLSNTDVGAKLNVDLSSAAEIRIHHERKR